jgi:hypothetical protein
MFTSLKWRAIAEPNPCAQRPVIGWVIKIYYLEFLRASEGTLSRWSRLHLQSLTPPSGRRTVVKIIAESIHNMIKNHVVPTPLSGIRVG